MSHNQKLSFQSKGDLKRLLFMVYHSGTTSLLPWPKVWVDWFFGCQHWSKWWINVLHCKKSARDLLDLNGQRNFIVFTAKSSASCKHIVTNETRNYLARCARSAVNLVTIRIDEDSYFEERKRAKTLLHWQKIWMQMSVQIGLMSFQWWLCLYVTNVMKHRKDSHQPKEVTSQFCLSVRVQKSFQANNGFKKWVL